MDHNISLRLKRTYAVVAHSPNLVELRCGVWNPTSLHLADEVESGNFARPLISPSEDRPASELAEITEVPRAECGALFDHLVQLGVVEDAPTSALDHYIDHIVPTLRSARKEGKTRPVRLLGEVALTAEIERNLKGSSLRINAEPPGEPLASVLAGREG